MTSFPDLLRSWISQNAGDLASDGVQAILTEGPQDRDRRAVWADFDSANRLARLTVWDTGEAVLALADAAAENPPVTQQLEFASSTDLERAVASAVAWVAE